MLEEADAHELYELIDANRDYLACWMPWAARQTFDETLSSIRSTQRQLVSNDGFQAGVAGFHTASWQHRSTSIGYWLAESVQGAAS